MAITDIQISEELQTGAPSIKYRGNEGPKSPMEMAMADPMLIEEYEKYVYAMQEQGQEPVSFEQFVQEIMSGMAKGGRAGYGLGSLVRSITRPFKKAAKSDLGKAALTAAAAYGLHNFGLPGTKGFGTPDGGFGAGFFSKAKPFLLGSPASWTKPTGTGPLDLIRGGTNYIPGTKGILGAYGTLSPLKALTATSLLPMTGLGMGEEETIDFDLKNIPDSQKFASDYSQMRKDIGDAIASGVKENFTEVLNKYNLTEGVNINFWEDIRKPSAQGGRIGKAEGGIMDLGGMEKDYRNTGGFVDLGAKEKADDVPARLSVNEFVMTADAVRGAGDGDIDLGAERMEDLMEKLEAKNKRQQGASDMFEVSERLSAVV